MAAVIIEDGVGYNAPACGFAREGYSFLLWNTAANGSGTSYSPGCSISVNSDMLLYALWGATRTVSFDANEGIGTMAAGTVGDGGSYTAPECAFSRPGYAFLGWNTAADGKGLSINAGGSIVSVTADITLYAIWGANRVIAFDANGGGGTMNAGSVGDGGSYTVASNAFSRAGYTFLHWNTQSGGGGTSYSPGQSIDNVTADITLYAIWIADRVVTYSANYSGGATTTASVAYNGSYTVASNAFTRAGYSFLRWNTAANDSGTQYNPGQSIANVTADITLYAIWGATRTIAFDANGGGGTMNAGSVGDGGSYTVASNAFSRAGYTFLHWNTQSGGGGTSYSPGQSIDNVTADITLYAIWIADRVVTYSANYSGGATTTASVAYNGSYTVASNGFTRAGYSFLRWNTAANDSGAYYYPGENIDNVTADITLYAIWGANRTIAFDANGGGGTMAAGTVGSGSSYTVPACSYSRTGFSFLRWSTASDGSGSSYSPGYIISSVTADISLYAIWIADRVITYDANYSGGTTTAASVAYGGSYSIGANPFSRSGYSFSHWNTQSSGGGTSYNPGDTIVSAVSDLTLYAVWIADRVITYDANYSGGTTTTASVVYGASYSIAANGFSRAGHVFSGWNTQANGGGTGYSPGDSIASVTSDLTLYAIWTANRTIAYYANGGVGTTITETVLDGTSYSVASSSFTRTDYTFAHWNTASDGSGTSYASGSAITITGDLSLYAIWTPLTYYVSFNVNNPNEGAGSMAAVEVARGTSYAVPASSFTRFPFTFASWNTQADGNGQSYPAGASIPSVDSNMTLYAIWTLRSDCVRFVGFEDGTSVSGLARNSGEGLFDPSSLLSIQTARAEFGSALRQNLSAANRLDIQIDQTGGYQDLWLMFDVYVESADQFPAGTHKPLILLYDSSTDATPGHNNLPKVFGTPLYKDVDGQYNGFIYLRPISNILPDTVTGRATQALEVDPVNGLMGRWINIKLRLKLDNSLAGLNLYIDKTLRVETIREGDVPETVHIDALRFWHHGDIYDEANNITSAPNTNIYFDNIGVYTSDPDAY